MTSITSVSRRSGWVLACALVMGLGTVAVLAVPTLAGAATTPFTQCPAVGQDTGCALLLTINPGGTLTLQSDSNQGPYDGVEDTLVGVQNNAGGFVSSLALSGSDIFGFDGDGICTYAAGGIAGSAGFSGDTYCDAAQLAGTDPVDYQGPANTFTVTDASDGSVDFAGGGLAPGASSYFSLEGTPSPGSITLVPVVVGSPATVSAVEGAAFTNQTVATFTDADPSATAASFSASINWGDASASTAGAVTGPQGGPYTVSGGHTYAEEGGDTVSVTITDVNLTANTSTVASAATIADAAITGTGVAIDATAGTATGPVTVATFTDANPSGTTADFSASVNWGDGGPLGAGTVSGPVGGPFTVTANHTYATAGPYSATVGISDRGGSTTSATDTVAVATVLIPCPAGKPCTGTATIPNSMSVTVSGTSSTNGVIVVQVGVGTLNCGDPFFHAPSVTTQTETGFTSTTDKIVTLDIAKSVVGKRFFLLYQVCYSGTTPFTDIFGHKNVTTGVLPYCVFVHNQAPCTISTTLSKTGDVIEKFQVPPSDPRYH